MATENKATQEAGAHEAGVQTVTERESQDDPRDPPEEDSSPR